MWQASALLGRHAQQGSVGVRDSAARYSWLMAVMGLPFAAAGRRSSFSTSFMVKRRGSACMRST